MDRDRVRVRGRVPDRAGGRTEAGGGVKNEVRGRVLSRIKVRGGVAVRGCIGTRDRVRGRASGKGRLAKEVADVPRGRSPTSGTSPRDLQYVWC